MKLRLDLVFPALLIASAGSQLGLPGGPVEARPADEACVRAVDLAQGEAESRIAAEGYAEIRILGVGCDSAWHAIASAEGDPVRLKVTAQGTVLTE